MKIVNLETFLKLSPGTVYSKFEPNVFGALEIKGETIQGSDDFFSHSIADAVKETLDMNRHSILSHAVSEGSSFELDFKQSSRDGSFNDYQLFAVWEESDVSLLLNHLTALRTDWRLKFMGTGEDR